ncbi:MAG: hypothetical protein NZ581_09165, partial [Candidatus Caldarchaeum sp.]|nr:hypothetical protein [Candidatus Caldarchaeum sp.]MDW8436342.1 hypothetical protein [Candidatus Caldarchaeum sp.]
TKPTASSTPTRPVNKERNIAAIIIDQIGTCGNLPRTKSPARINADTSRPRNAEFSTTIPGGIHM